jgi:hypothetical protein
VAADQRAGPVAQPPQRLEPDANDEDSEEHEAFAPEHEAPSDRELNGNEHGQRRPSGAGDDAVCLTAADPRSGWSMYGMNMLDGSRLQR